MNPDELKLLQENNKMLRKLVRGQRWGMLWGVAKILLIVIPLILGYFYLEPYLGPFGKSLQQAQSVLNQFK